jgi:two-component system alkaline phosphatase synthesis response regulator PhoP
VKAAEHPRRDPGAIVGKKALVVDDSPTVRQVQKTLLDQQGYQVFTAEDGLEGVRLARAERPDVVLLDVVMPLMDGVECCRRIKRDRDLQGTTVFMVTGKEELAQLRAAYAAGCDGYLTKPLDVQELLVKISSVERLRKARGDVRKVLDRRPG